MKDQWEEEAIERFRIYLSQSRKSTYGVTGRDVVPHPQTKKNFDYQLQNEKGNKIAVEIFRFVEDGDLARTNFWNTVIQAIKDETTKRNLAGYLIYTPHFSISKKEIPSYAVKIAEVIQKGIEQNPTEKRFYYGDFEFHKIEGLMSLSFSHTSGARFLNTKGAVINTFAANLPKKNKQIETSDHERILLVVNWSYFVDSFAATRALSTFNFDQFQNVERIFFEQRKGEFNLIYDKEVVQAIKVQTQITDPLTHKLLIEYLQGQLEDKDLNAFKYIKAISTASVDWLSEEAKESLILMAQEFPEQNIEDAMWVIRKLANDSNPSSKGENDPDDPKGEYNYSAQILKNEEIRNITTVRGHLCWLMAHVIAKNQPQYYSEIIEILQRYISEDNLYIRVQATYPLIELILRRHATKNQDGSIFDWKQEERDLVTKLPMRLLRANIKYPRVLEALIEVFKFFGELTDNEAEEVLKVLISTQESYILHELPHLLIYYRFFRVQDFPERGYFDVSKFETILRNQIQFGKGTIKSSLVWHFWNILNKERLSYDEVREYIFLFWENGYDPDVASMFSLLFEELLKVAPEDAKYLFHKVVDLLQKYLTERPYEPHQAYINGTEEVIQLLASEPEVLIQVIDRLKDISHNGVYIGDLTKIFESYKLVAGEDKVRVRNELKRIYVEIKAEYANVYPVNWDS